MLAMKKAVEKYDGAKGSFLPYFNHIYSNMLLEQDKLTVTGGVKIDKRKFEIIKRVREVLEARYGKRYEIYKIPPHILNSVLEALVPPVAQDRE